jgi:peptidyl-prolyl cis-trans isomerase C
VVGAYLEHAAEGKVTDQALRERYRVFTESLRGEEEIHVRHILLKVRSQAISVIKELAAGADFEALARRMSAGPSKAQGGDLGYLRRDAMLNQFADAAFGRKVGQVTSTPIGTQFGWHVIKLEDRRAATITPFDQMRPQLDRQIRDRMADEIVRKLRRNARIMEFNLDGKPKSTSASKFLPTGTR